MKCERIEELILTDYIDGELNAVHKAEVDEHLSACPRCAAFLRTVKTTVEPFSHAETLSVPSSLWLQIKEKIQAEENARPLREGEGVWSQIKSLFVLPRPAVAMTVIAAFLMVGVLAGVQQYHQASAKDASEYLEAVSEISELSFNGGNGFDTVVEQYFL